MLVDTSCIISFFRFPSLLLFFKTAKGAPGSLVDEAGLRVGDVVFAFNGITLRHARTPGVATELRDMRGDIRLHVRRGGSAPSL